MAAFQAAYVVRFPSPAPLFWKMATFSPASLFSVRGIKPTRAPPVAEKRANGPRQRGRQGFGGGLEEAGEKDSHHPLHFFSRPTLSAFSQKINSRCPACRGCGVFLGASARAGDAWETAVASGELRWGRTPPGARPVFRDDHAPDRLVGFGSGTDGGRGRTPA